MPLSPDDPFLADFRSDETLLGRSLLEIIINREVDDGLHQLAVRIRAEREGGLRLAVRHTWTSDEHVLSQDLLAQDVLALWRGVRASGFLERVMAGETPAPGTDVYLAGAAGDLGLGWTISTSWAGLEQDRSSRRLVQLIDGLATERSELFATERARFLPLAFTAPP